MNEEHPGWARVASLANRPPLSTLVQDRERNATLVRTLAGIRFDWTRTHFDAEVIGAFLALAEERGFDAQRRALFAGDIVNRSEGRPAEHTAERGLGSDEAVALATLLHKRMRALVEAIRGGLFGPVRSLLHIGIGGSALGPALLIDALGRNDASVDVRVVSNVDGAALTEATRDLDPRTTMVAIASKTFTTAETMLNAASAIDWLREGGVEDPLSRVIALTASPDKAVEFGVDDTRILPFAPTVGGRYSIWSSIGFPVALALGWDRFEELLAGGRCVDEHFRDARAAENVPLHAAFVDLFYSQVVRAETRAVFAYDERLRLLPPYLQQLEMESNGKSVRADGSPLGRPSAPITWGGVGTDAQHAVFQLLHQGTHVVPVEFVAVIEPGHDLDEAHHRALLGNAIAQGAALAEGRAAADGNVTYPGNRPSTTILLETLDARTLGALIAFYEHRTYAHAVLLGINPFDQHGVELGKEMAKRFDDPEAEAADPASAALLEAVFGGAAA